MALFKAFFDWFLQPLRPTGAAPGASVPVSGKQPTFAPSDTAEPAAATLAVCNLDGRGGDTAAMRLAGLLGVRDGIEVRHWNRVLKLSGGGSLAQRLANAAEEGRDWLAAEKVDLLIWGEVADGTAVLRFLPAQADSEGRPGSFGLGDTLEIPAGIDEDLLDLVLATALAAAAPARQGQRHRLGRMLAETCDKANGWIEAPPPGLPPGQLASVLNCLGSAFGMAWRLSRESHRLERAIAAHKAAVEACPENDRPLTWSLSQHHLAADLEARADTEKTVEPLEEAADAYRAVADSLGRGEYPYDWAQAHNRLGQVLYKIAARRGRAQELKDATAAFEQALEVYTRTAMPGRWSEVMNQLGVALLALGEQVSGTVVLDQAAAAFRKALEVRRRDAAPLLWAQTANNLGAATFALAKRNGDVSLMHEAHACFEGAIEVYREHQWAKTVHVIEKNLHRVERLIQARGG